MPGQSFPDNWNLFLPPKNRSLYSLALFRFLLCAFRFLFEMRLKVDLMLLGSSCAHPKQWCVPVSSLHVASVSGQGIAQYGRVTLLCFGLVVWVVVGGGIRNIRVGECEGQRRLLGSERV